MLIWLCVVLGIVVWCLIGYGVECLIAYIDEDTVTVANLKLAVFFWPLLIVVWLYCKLEDYDDVTVHDFTKNSKK